MSRVKNRFFAWIFTRFPRLFDVERLAEQAEEVHVEGVPWTPFTGPLSEATVAIVTTAGVHLLGQPPFDMVDKDGDPTFREIAGDTPKGEYTITHDYYDHKDADKDINIVFPIDRLWEMKESGVIGGVADTHFGFMGHIVGPHVETLLKKTAPEVAERLKSEGVDVVLLTPG
jgi:D-proline reductase (dithiol) PrdB